MAVQPPIPVSIVPVTGIARMTEHAFVIVITRASHVSWPNVQVNVVWNTVTVVVTMAKSK